MGLRTFFAAALACWIAPAAAQYGPPGEGEGLDLGIYTALWWNPAESGWGLNTTHQGSILFATLFTYAADGQPLWLVASSLTRTMDDPYGYGMATPGYSGALYRTTGPAFNASPWTTFNYEAVGSITMEFVTPTRARLTYSYGGVTVSKSVQRQEFASPVPECVAVTGSRAAEANYQDLWWNPAESGWGINLVHQGSIIFATLFTYAESGRDRWFVASGLARQPDGAFTGALFSTTGPPFDASPWLPIGYAQVGDMTLRFGDGENGTLTYNVGTVTVTKQIRRQVFAAVTSACR